MSPQDIHCHKVHRRESVSCDISSGVRAGLFASVVNKYWPAMGCILRDVFYLSILSLRELYSVVFYLYLNRTGTRSEILLGTCKLKYKVLLSSMAYFISIAARLSPLGHWWKRS